LGLVSEIDPDKRRLERGAAAGSLGQKGSFGLRYPSGTTTS